MIDAPVALLGNLKKTKNGHTRVASLAGPLDHTEMEGSQVLKIGPAPLLLFAVMWEAL